MADDDTTAKASKDDEGTNDTSNDDQNASGDSGTSNDTSSENDDKGDTVSKADLDSALARMKAADKRASDLQKIVDEAARKDKSELENAQADLAKQQKANEELLEKINAKALENAFLTNSKYSWHDADDALRLLDREGVEVKDGEVTGLLPAIERLAKKKPHLLKNDDGDEDGKNSSGTATNGKRKGDGKAPNRDYSSRFPALRKPASKAAS